MDTLTLVLMKCGLILGTLALVKSFDDLHKKILAVQKLRKIIFNKNRNEIHRIQELVKEISDNPLNVNAISEAQEIIESSLTNLTKTERRQIAQGLYQNSRQGKRHYLVSLLAKY